MVDVNKITQQKKREVTFIYSGKPGQKVALAGTFNDWDADAVIMRPFSDDKTYSVALFLLPGNYEYKFVVDGEWLLDEDNPGFTTNDFGTLNSRIPFN